MERRVVCAFLVILMCSSTLSAPSSAQTSNSGQPSPIDNILHFWGNEDASDCWENFDPQGTSGSAEQGYGEEVDGGDAERLEVSISCRMKFSFEENVYLNPTGKIAVEFGLRLDHADAESDEDEDLTITLMKGNVEIDSRSFPNVATNEDVQLSWELDVGENSTWWNRSEGEPSVRFEISKVGWDASGTPCSGPLQLLKCGGTFRLYYSNNQEGLRSQIQFPIADAPEVIEEPDSGSKKTPGFGFLASLAAVCLAFTAHRRRHQTPPRYPAP